MKFAQLIKRGMFSILATLLALFVPTVGHSDPIYSWKVKGVLQYATQCPPGMRCKTETITPSSPAPAPASSSPVPALLWSAGAEGGDLREWYSPMPTTGAGGGIYNSGDGMSVTTQEAARTGNWATKMVISSTQTDGTRLFRWFEQTLSNELYYSAWFYFPAKYTAGYGGWLNLIQWKSVMATQNDPFFILGVNNYNKLGMPLTLTWWPGLKIEGPYPGQSGGRTWTSSLELPVGRWFNLEVRYLSAGDFTGAIQVWQDGVEIFNLNGIKTRYSDGTTQWSVNNYGYNLSPSPVVIYMDDAAISTTRVHNP